MAQNKKEELGRKRLSSVALPSSACSYTLACTVSWQLPSPSSSLPASFKEGVMATYTRNFFTEWTSGLNPSLDIWLHFFMTWIINSLCHICFQPWQCSFPCPNYVASPLSLTETSHSFATNELETHTAMHEGCPAKPHCLNPQTGWTAVQHSLIGLSNGSKICSLWGTYQINKYIRGDWEVSPQWI